MHFRLFLVNLRLDGHHMLAWAQTFTDKTGQSYYGEHILFYLDVKNYQVVEYNIIVGKEKP